MLYCRCNFVRRDPYIWYKLQCYWFHMTHLKLRWHIKNITQPQMKMFPKVYTLCLCGNKEVHMLWFFCLGSFINYLLVRVFDLNKYRDSIRTRPGRRIFDDDRLQRLLQPSEIVGKYSFWLLLPKKTSKKVVYDYLILKKHRKKSLPMVENWKNIVKHRKTSENDGWNDVLAKN